MPHGARPMRCVHTHKRARTKVRGGETTGTFGLDNNQRVVDAAVRLEGCGGGEQVSTRPAAAALRVGLRTSLEN
jgi:hypothetical protein